jgi:hypothetical protein
MNIDKIKSIQFSLMKRETDIKEGKAEYTKKVSAKIKIPDNFFEPGYEESMLEQLISRMYSDLMTKAPDDADSLGLWIEYDTITIDNAMSLRALDSIQEHSKQNINSIVEFFKMTLQD